MGKVTYPGTAGQYAIAEGCTFDYELLKEQCNIDLETVRVKSDDVDPDDEPDGVTELPTAQQPTLFEPDNEDAPF